MISARGASLDSPAVTRGVNIRSAGHQLSLLACAGVGLPQSASGGVELQPPTRCTRSADSQDGSRPQAPESFIIPN